MRAVKSAAQGCGPSKTKRQDMARDLKRIFVSFDSDGSGAVDEEEFGQVAHGLMLALA